MIERNFTGNFNAILKKIEEGVLGASMSASLEHSADMLDGATRCSVRVFERYSAFGNNRVSMSVTLFQGESGVIKLVAATSGGSQAMFWKINTIGEESFLKTLEDIL